jgi:hypothetical protein
MRRFDKTRSIQKENDMLENKKVWRYHPAAPDKKKQESTSQKRKRWYKSDLRKITPYVLVLSADLKDK